MESKNKFMLRAIELSVKSANGTGGPFGCVVVKNNKILAEGSNNVTFLNDPTAHAEIVAIRNACKKLNTFNLSGCDIFTSCEPCPMCLAAMRMAGINQVRYAFSNADAEPFSLSTAKIAEMLRMPPEKQEGLIFKQITPLQNLDLYKVWQSYQEK